MANAPDSELVGELIDGFGFGDGSEGEEVPPLQGKEGSLGQL